MENRKWLTVASERTYFGEVETVRIAGDLSLDKGIANVTFTHVDRHNKESEVTITINKELAERFVYYLTKSIEGDDGTYVEFY